MLFLVSTSFLSCNSGQKNISSYKKTEVIELKFKQFQPADTVSSSPFISSFEKVWYRDSMAIESVSGFFSTTDSKGNTIEKDSTLHYRFSNLRKGTVYEYGSFSDTSTLIRKYSYSDSIKMFGGWGFNYARRWDYEGAIKNIPDTIIGDTFFKRLKIHRTIKNIPYIIDCYFMCDKKDVILNLDIDLSHKIGCPLVKIYWYSPIKKGLHIVNEIKYV